MKKVTDFIVEKRNFILILFLILTGVCVFLMSKVNINYELSKYLPESSETRKGMDIMEDEFGSEDSSYLYLMFEDLDNDKKNSIFEELKEITGVSSVSYDETENYNKDNYTYYVINVSDKEDSKTAKDVYETVKNNYEDYTTYMSGTIAERNGPVLQTWIVALAIGCAMVILIIMCESYVEPFLFLFAIGLAVFLNKGTNIIFPSVSNITDSIVAILQMALSMDYSIMLMNRYSQEKEKDSNKVNAMKKALYASFSSISSSSITTIVGMLALVFMSFTIGRDLGLVLAKGVLFSLISIFFCLPGLILIFDKLIQKTRKKVFNIKLDWLGKFAYKIRFIAPILLIVLFVGSYFLKGNLLIAYTSSEEDKIAEVFPENNQIAVVYKNNKENNVAEFCRSLKSDDYLSTVLCFGNTINEDLSYTALKEKMADLGTDVSVDDYLLKIIYYDYFNKDSIKISYEEFVNFVENNVLKQDSFKDKIDSSIKNNIKLLGNFTKVNEINKKRNASEIAAILGLEESTVNDLFIYYNSKNVTSKITLPKFINFLNRDVLTNAKYASMIDNNSKEKIKMLTNFMDASLLTKNLDSKTLSSLFNMDEVSIKQLMFLNYSNKESNKTMSIASFISNVLFLKDNTNHLDGVDVSSLKSLEIFSNNEGNINETSLNKTTLETLFSKFGPNLVSEVYTNLQLPDSTLMSPVEFVTTTLECLGDYLSNDQKQGLTLLKKVMNDSLNNYPEYKASEIASILGMEKTGTYQIYVLTDLVKGTMDSYTMTPSEFVKFVLQNNSVIGLDSNTIDSLELLDKVFDAVISNKSFSAKELANLFGMNEESINLLYGLYSYKNKTVTISLNTMVNFLMDDVLNNLNFASLISDDAKAKLVSVRNIMDSSLNHNKYSYHDLTASLKDVAGKLDENMISLLYTYYGSENNYNEEWKMNLMNFVVFLHDDILNDTRFKSFITDELKTNVESAKEMVNEAKDLLVGENYSRMILNTKYLEESEETFNFIKNIKENLNDDDIYVIGNSPMALEMSETFQDELNLITILTMIFIFVVVAFTFKSLLIPLVLVILIQCAVYVTMGILSVMGGSVYFIALLIVQSILMGATIDYAILYTSYYLESRKSMDRKQSLINAYNKSIHTILTSASILIIVTLIVGSFASAIAAKICKTLSQGTLCSSLLILIVLPSVLVAIDKFIVKNKTK